MNYIIYNEKEIQFNIVVYNNHYFIISEQNKK